MMLDFICVTQGFEFGSPAGSQKSYLLKKRYLRISNIITFVELEGSEMKTCMTVSAGSIKNEYLKLEESAIDIYTMIVNRSQ